MCLNGCKEKKNEIEYSKDSEMSKIRDWTFWQLKEKYLIDIELLLPDLEY